MIVSAINKRKKEEKGGEEGGKERKEKASVRDSAWPLKMSARNVAAATPFPWNRNMTVRFLRHVCRLSSRFLVNTLHLLICEASDNRLRVPINFLMQISRRNPFEFSNEPSHRGTKEEIAR